MHIQKLTGSRRSGIGIQHQLTFHCDWSCCSPTPSATKKKAAAGAGIQSLAAEPSLAV